MKLPSARQWTSLSQAVQKVGAAAYQQAPEANRADPKASSDQDDRTEGAKRKMKRKRIGA